MAKINIIYGSTTGNTESVAQRIADKLSDHEVKITNVAGAASEDFDNYDLLIVGTSTWGFGDHQDDWMDFESKIESLKLQGKKMAFFGLGDQDGYPETFVDAMGLLYSKFSVQGIELIGAYTPSGLSYDFSKAELDSNRLVGLVLDEDNQADQTDSRIAEWIASVVEEL